MHLLLLPYRVLLAAELRVCVVANTCLCAGFNAMDLSRMIPPLQSSLQKSHRTGLHAAFTPGIRAGDAGVAPQRDANRGRSQIAAGACSTVVVRTTLLRSARAEGVHGPQLAASKRNDVALWVAEDGSAKPALVVKDADGPGAVEELINEVAAYDALRPLQGASPGIPLLVSAGWHALCRHDGTLIVRHAGRHTGVSVSPAVWQQAVPAVKAVFELVWGAAIVHCDVARRNVVLDPTTTPPRVTLIDFGRAKRGATPAEIAQERACVEAMCCG